MHICPQCRAFSADPQLAFCLADGTPLANVDPQSEQFKEGSRVIEEQAKRLSKRSRRLRWRKIALASMMTLVMTTVVVTSFTVETTTAPSDIPPVPSPSPSPPVKRYSLPSDSPSPTPSPSLSVSPTPTPTPTPILYKISGVVSSTGQPLSRIDIQLSGAKNDSTKTDPNGRYTFSGLRAGGNYTVTPMHLQIVFLPASRSFALSKDEESADFPADVVKISGRVMQNGRPLSRVKISLQGSKSAAEFTNNDGYYSFGNLRAGGSYTVIPRPQETEPAQKFDPPSAGFENLRRDDAADFKIRNDQECLERNMEREAEKVFRASSSRLRDTIDKDERERAAIHDKYGEGVKQIELRMGPLQPEHIRFLEPCKVFVVTVSYSWQVTFPGNAIAPPRTKQVPRTRDFTCEKRKDGWQCR